MNEIAFSVLIGGALTLLGTLLGNYLQYRSTQRLEKKDLAKERLLEVRRYVVTCLEFADLVYLPTLSSKSFNFGNEAFAEWESSVEEHYKKWNNLPVNGSARVLFVDDKEILDGLAQIDQLKLQFYLSYLDISDKRKVKLLDEEREELKKIAARVGNRLDKIISEM